MNCEHSYKLVHWDGIYRCQWCGHRTRWPVYAAAPTPPRGDA